MSDNGKANIIAGAAVMLLGMIGAAAIGALTHEGLGYAFLVWAKVLPQ